MIGTTKRLIQTEQYGRGRKRKVGPRPANLKGELPVSHGDLRETKGKGKGVGGWQKVGGRYRQKGWTIARGLSSSSWGTKRKWGGRPKAK